LDKTADKSFLYEWRKRIGHEEAARQTREAAAIGTILHNQLEQYILGNEISFGSNLIHQIAGRMADRIINQGLTHVDEVWGCEVGLIAPDAYAGTTDCVGLYRGRPSIIDFKNSKKIKKREWITDYLLQGVAYSIAHNEMFDTDIRQVVILMADRQGEFCEYILADEEFDQYALMWANRVIDFYTKR
jgi:hypothetical protein